MERCVRDASGRRAADVVVRKEGGVISIVVGPERGAAGPATLERDMGIEVTIDQLRRMRARELPIRPDAGVIRVELRALHEGALRAVEVDLIEPRDRRNVGLLDVAAQRLKL